MLDRSLFHRPRPAGGHVPPGRLFDGAVFLEEQHGRIAVRRLKAVERVQQLETVEQGVDAAIGASGFVLQIVEHQTPSPQRARAGPVDAAAPQEGCPARCPGPAGHHHRAGPTCPPAAPGPYSSTMRGRSGPTGAPMRRRPRHGRCPGSTSRPEAARAVEEDQHQCRDHRRPSAISVKTLSANRTCLYMLFGGPPSEEPQHSAVIRLAGALLSEQNEEWLVQRRYLPVESMALILGFAHVRARVPRELRLVAGSCLAAVPRVPLRSEAAPSSDRQSRQPSRSPDPCARVARRPRVAARTENDRCPTL